MTAEGEHTKTRLLSEARDLYLEGGFAGFSLREVARRAGVSAPAVYRHYDGKEALLKAVCIDGFRIFSSYLMRALAAPTPADRMNESARQYLQFALQNPHDYRFIFMGGSEAFSPLAPSAGADLPPLTFQFLIDRVTECMKAKVLAKGDPERVAGIIWAHVHGLASLRLSGHFQRVGDDAAFSRFFADSTALLLKGLHG